MTIVVPLHTLATIIWLGGLFFLCFMFQPGTHQPDATMALSSWQRVLSRFFGWAWVSLALILISGISIVFLEFGGFSGIPSIHRGNMLIGIPAIILFGYLYFRPWQRFRRAMSCKDWSAAENSLRQARIIMAIILALGLIASVVSIAGRYYSIFGLNVHPTDS